VKQHDADDDWWGARIIFESVHPDPGDGSRYTLFEEQTILVRAPSEADARVRARTLGEGAELEYKNVYGNTVRWVFKGVLDIFDVSDDHPKEGTEIYSAFIHGESHLNRLKRQFRVTDW
jgi:Domain of unknown function (DUF4288)